ncbi:MAG: Cas9 endonuclease PAM-interacting domain-containing protein, partial [Bacilli bacterium]
NVYNKTFSANFNEKLYQEHHDAFESMKIDPKHFFTQSKFIMGTNVCIWRAPYVKDGAEDPNDKSTLKTIQKYMAMNDPMVTQMLKTQSGFFNKTSIHSVADGGNCFPLKANGIFNKPGWEKNYGGYSDMTSPYYMLVKSDGKNGKSSYSLETIPSIIAAGMGDDNQKKLNYLTTTLKLKNPEIILKKLLIRTVIELPVTTSKGKVGKARMGISGKSGNYLICVNLSELHLPKEYQDYSKKISIVLGTTLPAGRKKDLSKVDQKTNEPLFDNRTKVTKEENQKLFDYYCDVVLNKPCFIGLPATSSYITKILDNHDKFASLSTFDQITVLSSITYLLACKINAAKCNFSSLGMALHCGPIYLPKQLPAGASIIAQSPTGFYEKVLFTVPKE